MSTLNPIDELAVLLPYLRQAANRAVVIEDGLHPAAD
jgi:hypothetical protein